MINPSQHNASASPQDFSPQDFSADDAFESARPVANLEPSLETRDPIDNTQPTLIATDGMLEQAPADASDSTEAAPLTAVEHRVTDDLEKLMAILPDHLRQALQDHADFDTLIEVVMDLGRQPEARFPDKAEYLSETVVTREDLAITVGKIGEFGGDNRAGIERTLHRISAMRNRRGEVIGLTCRVGRAVYGTIGMIRDLVESGQSILMLGRPGVGKTTALREIARILADDLNKRVVVIDSSNEIAGDGDIPHAAIGRARRMQVSRPELQHQVMIEAVENHMPEVIVIDEIGTELEAQAARTIAERGVQLVGTAHGNHLENLIKNPTLSDLVGGIQSVTLGDEEARRRGSQKSVLERKALPTFDIAVEMLERQRWVVHEAVAQTVDQLLRGRQPNPQVRTVDADGQVIITQESGGPAAIPPNGRGTRHVPLGGQAIPFGNRVPASGTVLSPPGWRSTGRIQPLPAASPASNLASNLASSPIGSPIGDPAFEQLLEQSLGRNSSAEQQYGDPNGDYRSLGLNGEDLPLQIYPYGLARTQLEQVIMTLQLPIVLTKDIDGADAVLALRSHVKNHSKLRHIAKARHIPVHTLKSNSMPQIAAGLRRMLNLDDQGLEETPDLTLFARTNIGDELEALEEARLAVEQIVIPQGQPVELLPRSADVRKMQHELVEHYRLKSRSCGDEPNRRLRIYPA
jgi:stage III sporulation protein SpoIIIAA